MNCLILMGIFTYKKEAVSKVRGSFFFFHPYNSFGIVIIILPILYLPSGRAGLVTATRLRPALK
jgi:hypothetical protein